MCNEAPRANFILQLTVAIVPVVVAAWYKGRLVVTVGTITLRTKTARLLGTWVWKARGVRRYLFGLKLLIYLSFLDLSLSFCFYFKNCNLFFIFFIGQCSLVQSQFFLSFFFLLFFPWTFFFLIYLLTIFLASNKELRWLRFQHGLFATCLVYTLSRVRLYLYFANLFKTIIVCLDLGFLSSLWFESIFLLYNLVNLLSNIQYPLILSLNSLFPVSPFFFFFLLLLSLFLLHLLHCLQVLDLRLGFKRLVTPDYHVFRSLLDQWTLGATATLVAKDLLGWRLGWTYCDWECICKLVRTVLSQCKHYFGWTSFLDITTFTRNWSFLSWFTIVFSEILAVVLVSDYSGIISSELSLWGNKIAVTHSIS